MLYIMIFILGAIIGSFLNVCIYRIPINKKIITGRSKCTSCNREIRWFDLIPIISFFILKGKCRDCRSGINFRYAIVETLTGLIFALIVSILGITWQSVIYLILSSLLIVGSVIDLDYKIIPNRIPLIIFAIAIVSSLTGIHISIIDLVIGLAVGFGFLFLLSLGSIIILKKDGMGGGDIKLMGAVGALIGWELVLLALMLSAYIAIIFLIPLITLKLLKANDSIPYGPFLSLGSLVAILYGNNILKMLGF